MIIHSPALVDVAVPFLIPKCFINVAIEYSLVILISLSDLMISSLNVDFKIFLPYFKLL